MGFRMPATLEIRDDRHIEENIYPIGSANRIYVTRVRWKCIILEGRRRNIKGKGILPRDSRDRKRILKFLPFYF